MEFLSWYIVQHGESWTKLYLKKLYQNSRKIVVIVKTEFYCLFVYIIFKIEKKSYIIT